MNNPIHTLVLMGVLKRKTYREIAEDIGKTPGTVQYHMKYLIREKYVVSEKNPATGRAKARGLELTPKGEGALTNEGLLPSKSKS